MRSRVRVALRVGAALLVLAGVPLVWFGDAAAEAPDRVGWWFKANQNPLLPPVAPPNVPPGGLYVANDPSGPAGISALRYFSEGTEAATLTLQVDPSATARELAIVACPATGPWDPAAGGEFARAPTDACDTTAVPGTPAADGSTVTWELSSAFGDGTGGFDVVLKPTPGNVEPFQVPFKPPDDTSFTPSSGGSSESTFEFSDGGGAAAFDSSTFDGSTFGGSTFDTPAFDGGFSTPSFDSGGSFDVGAPPDVGAPSAGGELGAGAGDESVALTTRPPAKVPAVPTPDTTAERITAVVLLLAMAAGLWWLSTKPLPSPRLLGGLRVGAPDGAAVVPAVAAPAAGGVPLVADVAQPVRNRGIGRFARARTAPPTRL